MAKKVNPGMKVTLDPGANTLLWRDNDDELRMWAEIAVRWGNRETRLEFEFPLLYRHKGELTPVAGLGKTGWVAASAELRGA